jgi:hypothetical protein
MRVEQSRELARSASQLRDSNDIQELRRPLGHSRPHTFARQTRDEGA